MKLEFGFLNIVFQMPPTKSKPSIIIFNQMSNKTINSLLNVIHLHLLCYTRHIVQTVYILGIYYIGTDQVNSSTDLILIVHQQISSTKRYTQTLNDFVVWRLKTLAQRVEQATLWNLFYSVYLIAS